MMTMSDTHALNGSGKVVSGLRGPLGSQGCYTDSVYNPNGVGGVSATSRERRANCRIDLRRIHGRPCKRQVGSKDPCSGSYGEIMTNKHSDPKTFFKKKWIAIASLLVALIGGVLGFVSVVKQITEHPILSYRLVNIIHGQQENYKTKLSNTMVLITGTISNEGNATLTPAYFELKGTINHKSIQFEKQLIPENAMFHSQEQSIEVENPSRNDLQRYNSTISKGMPLHGHLMFLAPQLDLDEFRVNLEKLKLWLVYCV